MSPTRPATDSFQEIFCAQYGVPAERYIDTVLRLTLYPHARWLAGLGSSACLAPDRAFIASVGGATRWRGFSREADEFQCLAENRRFWRRSLRLRVSVARMSALFSEVMGSMGAVSGNEVGRSEQTESEPRRIAAE